MPSLKLDPNRPQQPHKRALQDKEEQRAQFKPPVLLIVAVTLIALLGSQWGRRPDPVADGGRGLVIDRTNKFTQVVKPRAALKTRSGAQSAIITVTYVGFSGFPGAQAAFQHAVDIWANLIVASVPITIHAEFAPLEEGVLGGAGPGRFYRNFANAPVNGRWYPVGLANQYRGSDLDPAGFDIEATFASNISEWYFGTDGNTPANQVDFTTTVLHEIGHGLGIAGSMRVSGGVGDWGLSTGFPLMYDVFAVNGSIQFLTDTSLFPNPSAALATQLLSNNIWWNGLQAYNANGFQRPRLYGPVNWLPGSSFSHLDESTYPPGNPNSLMTYAIGYAESIHNPGPIVTGMLRDLGWATGCGFSVSSTTLSGSSAGGSGSFNVVGPAGCAWSAVSNTAFVTITSGGAGSGSGAVGFSVAANPLGASRSGTISVAGQTVTITQSGLAGGAVLSLDRGVLNFAAVTTGSAFVSKTSAQTLRLLQSGAGSVAWTATSNVPWLTVTPSSGSGSRVLTVSVKFVPGLAATASGAITVAVNGVAAVSPVAVRLGITSNGASASPVGKFDTPVSGITGVTGSIGVTGWALDDVQITRVRILRDPVAGETPGTLIFIGDAAFVEGARPDVAAGFASHPQHTRAGWGYMLLTNFLPALGNGTFRLHAYADDIEGHSTLLGTKIISCTNSVATAPFGAIDTPGQGSVVSGTVNNFGWVLAPGLRRADPPNGGTVNVFIDGAPVGAPAGWTSRTDLTGLFPSGLYNGVSSALGVFSFDSTTLTNGVHTISWGVTDNLGSSAGVGSRYFTVSNGSTLTAAPAASLLGSSTSAILSEGLLGRRGFSLDEPYAMFEPNADGTITIQSEELDRIELKTHATEAGLRSAGSNGALPIGARLDSDGTFTWHPGVGFVGAYEFVFASAAGQQRVWIVLNARGSNRVGPQIVIDAPAARQDVTTTFTIAGWAADLDSTRDTGIDAVHIWAYPVAGGAPIFMGAAATQRERPDVSAIYGGRFAKTGYDLTVRGFARGTYDVAVFAWSTGTRRVPAGKNSPNRGALTGGAATVNCGL